MAEPFRIHWYVKGPLPETVTDSATLPPFRSVAPCGWAVMLGYPCGTETASAADALVAEPPALVTETEYVPTFDCWAFATPRLGPVAPGIKAPLKYHWK